MRRIGLTGGIASGKSRVAAHLRDKGVPVIDADQLAREVVEPGTSGFSAIEARFPQVVRGGALDRKALGALVFADEDAKRALEAIVHPRIREEVERRYAELAASGAAHVVYEAALLVEKGLDRELDALLVVKTSPDRQLVRLRARDGLSEEEARLRLRAQAPLEDKLARATYVIENDDDDPERLAAEVDRVWAELTASNVARAGEP